MSLQAASPHCKCLILGSALWGWGTDKDTVFRLLTRFTDLGGVVVDTASNYPINKRPEDYGRAVLWLAEWLNVNPDRPLQVLLKFGALDNLGNPDCDLTPATLEQQADRYQKLFGNHLVNLSIHWDNRSESDKTAVAETLDVFRHFRQQGLSIGFSGVKHPDLYREIAPDLANDWCIQVKENLQSDSPRLHYSAAFPLGRFFAYGINMGGVKPNSNSASSSVSLRGIRHPQQLTDRLNHLLASEHGMEPPPASFNDIAMLFAYCNSALSGIVIGPRNIDQLENTLSYWRKLQNTIDAKLQTNIYAHLKSLRDTSED